MTSLKDLRDSIEKTRRKIYWWFALSVAFAGISGAIGEGFPNTIQSYLALSALAISFGILTRYAVRLNTLARLWRQQKQASTAS